MEENPFWGEPTPTDLRDNKDKLNGHYEELGWDQLLSSSAAAFPQRRSA